MDCPLCEAGIPRRAVEMFAIVVGAGKTPLSLLVREGSPLVKLVRVVRAAGSMTTLFEEGQLR